ncbi:hypothetical protein BUALT_Bualt13G0021200 [Buddleja alternifolia]|uniref:Nucleolar protein 10 n=1 Tax=Buddleja alternifolia TaxID=168488 RepID=A0AAV6WUX0_9LAMI|nr:hypothetical protein BUALT_Bualt13G0021200 [Buddleja alternifolia]
MRKLCLIVGLGYVTLHETTWKSFSQSTLQGRGYNVNFASSSNNTQNGNSNTDIKGHTAVAQPALTNEQYQQILHLIGSMSTDQSQNNGSTTNLASADNTARFSPDDKYARQRFLLKKRFGLLPTQPPLFKYRVL